MKNILIIFIIGIAVAGIFAYLSVMPVYPVDPIQYDRLGYNLAAGHGFSLSTSEPYLPTYYREPLYPAFLAFVYMLFGHNPHIAVIFQMVLHALTALLAYGIAKRVFSQKAALISGIAVAVFPTLASTSSYIMSETLFTFLLCLGIFMLIESVRSGRVYMFALSGLVFGMMTLTKAASLFLPLAVMPALIVALAVRKTGMRRMLVLAGCFIAIFVLVVSGWALRNKKVFNTFSVASRGGMIIWSRAAKVDDSPRQILATVCCSFSETLAKKTFPDIIDKPNRYLFKDIEKALALEDRYLKEGISPDEVDNMLKTEAYAKIRAYPFRYASYTFVEWLKMTAFTYLPLLNEMSVADYFSKLPDGHMMLTVLRGAMRSLAYPILVLFLAGMIRNMRLWYRWLLLFMVILYFNGIYSLLDAIGRYAVPLIPLYCIMAVAAIVPGPEAEE